MNKSVLFFIINAAVLIALTACAPEKSFEKAVTEEKVKKTSITKEEKNDLEEATITWSQHLKKVEEIEKISKDRNKTIDMLYAQIAKLEEQAGLCGPNTELSAKLAAKTCSSYLKEVNEEAYQQFIYDFPQHETKELVNETEGDTISN